MKWFRNFLYDESAASTIEYALMISLIVIVCIGAIVVLGQTAMMNFNTTSNALGASS